VITPTSSPFERIGLGLFTIPQLLDQDFAGTLAMLAGIGYKEVEFFGPFAFSAPDAIAGWAPIAKSLGMAGSGFYGLNATDVKALLDRNGLSTPSLHTDLTTLRTAMGALAEAAHSVGARYVVLPSLPPEHRQTLDDFKRSAELFNTIGAAAVAAGLRFAYHNHGYGLAEVNGKIPLFTLLDATDPELVDLQMDVYWSIAGRADPIALLQAYPNRYRLLHIKDMTEHKRFEGDGGDPQQWIAMFPYVADVGAGVFDLPTILAQAVTSGVQHFLVERDLTPTPAATLTNSYQYLAGLRAARA
jgi:sugar phosphate isomerase/epimerase